jgi:hypothetical protein
LLFSGPAQTEPACDLHEICHLLGKGENNKASGLEHSDIPAKETDSRSTMGKSPGLTLQASIVQDNVPVEIAPRVFVGSAHAAFNVDVLKEKRISHIVNLAGNYATFPEDFAYLSLSIRDKEYANLLSCLPVALLFMEAALAEHSSDEEADERAVLIHWCVPLGQRAT